MNKIDLLVLCNHPDILATIMRLIDNNRDWRADGLSDIDAALPAISKKPYKLILLGSGFAAEDENSLILKLRNSHPNLPVSKHYGGGSGLLTCEIYEGLKYLEINNQHKNGL